MIHPIFIVIGCILGSLVTWAALCNPEPYTVVYESSDCYFEEGGTREKIISVKDLKEKIQ